MNRIKRKIAAKALDLAFWLDPHRMVVYGAEIIIPADITPRFKDGGALLRSCYFH